MTASRLAPIMEIIRRMATRHFSDVVSDAQLLRNYTERDDEAAFTILLQRHGPMVFGICRRILGNESDADDVFQATFLVLIRRAGSIRRRQSLGSWLHGVALRLAQRVRSDAARRQIHESAWTPPAAAEADDSDIRPIIDEELARLHEKYRAPLVLCYLEGKTHDEAARQLGVPLGTICGRLARARNLLRARLTRRGLAPAAGTAALGFSGEQLLAAVPSTLVVTTARLAALLATAETTVGAPVSVAALVEGMMRTVFVSKVKVAAMFLIAAGVIGAGAAVLARQAMRNPVEERMAENSIESQEQPAPQAARVDLYGDPLPPEAVARLGTVRFRTGGFNRYVRFTPDQKYLITQGGVGVRKLDAISGKEVYAIPSENSDYDASLSKDGKLLATGSRSGLHIWDVVTGALKQSMPGIRASRVCFLPNGKHVACTGAVDNKGVGLFDADTGNRVWAWHEERAHPLAIECSIDGKTVFVASQGRGLYFLDAQTGRETHKIDTADCMPKQLAVSPDGELLAGACQARGADRVLVWSIPLVQEKHRFDSAPEEDQTRQKIYSALTFTPDSKALVTAGGSDGLVFWDMATGNELKRLGRGCTNSYSFTYSPDSKSIAVTRGNAVVILDAATSADRHPEYAITNPVNQIVFAPDGKLIVTVSGSRDARCWDRESGRHIRDLDLGTAAFKDSCRLTEDGRTLIIRKQAEKSLVFCDLDTGRERHRFSVNLPGTFPSLMAISPNSRLCAAGSHDGDTVYLLDSTTGKQIRAIHDRDLKLRNAHFIDQSNKLVVTSSDHTVRIWDLRSGMRLFQFAMFNAKAGVPSLSDGELAPYSAVISPDEKILAYTSLGGRQINDHSTIRLFDLRTGAVIREVAGTTNRSFRFSPDSRMLAWPRSGAHLLEIASGKTRHFLKGHLGQVHGITFSPDGRTLVTGSDDTTALIWDLTGRLTGGPDWGKPLSAAQLHAAWADLAGDDAAKAYQAIRRLAASPDSAVPYLAKQLPSEIANQNGNQLRALRAIETLEFAGTPAARGVLERIATGAPSVRLTQDAKESVERLRKRL